jgi:K+-sensing histidine kinase KdpD
MKVLVVEDFEHMARAIVTGLRREGMAVDVAHDGGDAGELRQRAWDEAAGPFTTAVTQRIRHGEGHGLGLAIVRAIADAHGAALTASPRPQGGLDMQVIFP